MPYNTQFKDTKVTPISPVIQTDYLPIIVWLTETDHRFARCNRHPSLIISNMILETPTTISSPSTSRLNVAIFKIMIK